MRHRARRARARPACRLRTSLAGCDEGRGFGASRPALHVQFTPRPVPQPEAVAGRRLHELTV
jgi:hypothetical protein